MSRRLAGLKNKLRPASTLAEIMWMLAATVAIYVLLAPLAFATAEMDGVRAAAVAAVSCLLGGLSGVFVVSLIRGLNPGYGMLVGMLPRMGVPLLSAILVYRQANDLVEAGFIYYLLVFYLVTLTVETWVAAIRCNPSDSATGNS